LAFSVLAGAFLLNALCGINSGEGSGDSVEAVVINDALPEVGGIGVSLLGKAIGVA
jgi:hypothetical protein